MDEQNYNSLSANLPEANFYQIITENASDGVVVLDTDSKYSYISPSSYHMFGYEPDEMHLLEPMELTHPDDLQFVLSEIQKTFENPNYKPTLEYRFRKKNGDWLWIESKISNLYHHNVVNGLVINFKDITERKAYVANILLNEARYRLTQEVGGIGSWEYCLKTKKYWNSHQLRILFGVDDVLNTDADEINRKIQSTICNPIPVNQALIDLIENNKSYDIEFEIIRQNDGEKRILYSHAELVTDFDCNFTLVRGIVRDITELRNREQKLKNSEALLDAALRHTRYSIWSIDSEYQLLYANDRFLTDFYQSFGINLELGKPIVDFIPEQIRNTWIEIYDKALANNTFIQEVNVNIAGFNIYVEVSATPIVVDGIVQGVSFYGDNITERKFDELKKVQNAENLRKLLKASNLFVKPKSKNIDFDEVIDFLRQISGARYVVFNRLYTDFSQAVSLVGLDNTRDILKKYLKIDFIAEKWKRNIIFDSKWLQNKLTIFENFDQVLNSEFNPTLVKIFLSRFKIGNVAVARIDGNERVVGNLIFVYEKGKVIENPELIEMFSYQLGQYLERLNAEEALLQKVNEMERFHKLTVNRELNMIELKREVNELLRKLGQEEKYRVVN